MTELGDKTTGQIIRETIQQNSTLRALVIILALAMISLIGLRILLMMGG